MLLKSPIKYSFHYISDTEEERQWKNYFTGKQVDTSRGVLSQSVAKGDTSKNCGVLVPPWNGWIDWVCQIQLKVLEFSFVILLLGTFEIQAPK